MRTHTRNMLREMAGQIQIAGKSGERSPAI